MDAESKLSNDEYFVHRLETISSGNSSKQWARVLFLSHEFVETSTIPMRKARYIPIPIALEWGFGRQVNKAADDLKNTRNPLHADLQEYIRIGDMEAASSLAKELAGINFVLNKCNEFRNHISESEGEKQ